MLITPGLPDYMNILAFPLREVKNYLTLQMTLGQRRMRKLEKTAVKKRRAKAEVPEIFVKVTDGTRSDYARAGIRVKGGKYHYLQWRDGQRIRYFYLGAKRNR